MPQPDIHFPCIGLHGPCAGCGARISIFKDLESIREAEISGLCQECQDDIFVDLEEEQHIESQGETQHPF